MSGAPTPNGAGRSSTLLVRGQARPMSVEALRSAVIALRAGAFDGLPTANAAVLQATAAWPTPSFPSPDLFGRPAVLVLAAHAGAGASTVALAVAEALSGHQQVQLVEYADPCRSGFDAASSRELGVDESGWRRGRRGAVDLARLAKQSSSDHDFPMPPSPGTEASTGERLLVIDAGLPAMPMLSGSRWVTALKSGSQVVVVTRMTVPALRQTEHMMSALEAPALLACVGSNHWPRVVTASCGPALRAARASGRVVTVPVDRRLAVSGLTPDPLPRPVAAAGRELADLLTLEPVAPGPSVVPSKELADVAVAAR